MKQVELRAPEDVYLVDVPQPSPGPGDVLIAVTRVGIGGSDLHAYHGSHPFLQLPLVPGHEFSGRIAALGEGVTRFTIGDSVTVEPAMVCGKCYNCLHGRYNICADLKVVGCQIPGAMAEYIVLPATKVLHLPDGVNLDQAALAEPLAVAVHAVRGADLRMGGPVLILGAGTVGLMMLQAAKALGAGKVMITDVIPQRLALAKELGADVTLNATEIDLYTAVESTFGPQHTDVIFECVGAEATVRDALRVARKGTCIVLSSIFDTDISLPLGLIQDWELQLVGASMYAHGDFPTALELLRDGKVQAEPLISHRFPLEKAAEAFVIADSRRIARKVLLELGET